MSFFEVRLNHDLENLSMRIKYRRFEKSIIFQLKILTEVYDGLYDFLIEFPEEYPFKSPKVKCLSKVFHPNIDSDGNVCLKILREGWMPSYDFNSVLVSLVSIFYYLSSEDALNTEAGLLLEQNFKEFKKRVSDTHSSSNSQYYYQDSNILSKR